MTDYGTHGWSDEEKMSDVVDEVNELSCSRGHVKVGPSYVVEHIHLPYSFLKHVAINTFRVKKQ